LSGVDVLDGVGELVTVLDGVTVLVVVLVGVAVTDGLGVWVVIYLKS
jgi:hypothetical protein